MASGNVFTEEGRTRWRNFGLRLWSYTLIFFVLGVAVGVFFFLKWTRGDMGALERLYIRQYVKSTALSLVLPDRPSKYVLLVSEYSGRRIGVTDELVYPVRDGQGQAVRDQHGWLFKPYSAGIAQPRWRFVRFPNAEMEAWFRQNIYGGESLSGLFVPALIACLITMVMGTALLVTIDQLINKRYEQGKLVRGNRLVEPRRYEREQKDADGLALIVKSMKPEQGIRHLVRWVTGSDESTWKLRMQRREEAQGALVLGDIGSGKSQILHRYLRQIAQRKDETAIVYDPACEFIKAHYQPKRGDVILNPLDGRSPFWSPVYECRQYNKTDYMTLADSFFPGRGDRSPSTDRFFNEAARDIFARLLEYHPDPEQLVIWLSDGNQINQLIDGTELAHYLDPKAAGQRGGVLATLAKVGKTLRLLPKLRECEFDFSLSEWAEERRGWIFLTSTKETEERLRPLYAAYLDLLMRRLLSVDEAIGKRRPVKVVVDEVHTLEYLPTLYKALTEGRKFGLHLIQGTQNKAQYDARYGKDAATMLSCPRYKILLRCDEPDSARWLSTLLGEEELEKPRTGVTASVSDQGRDSINYSSQTERRAIVSREEIAALPDLAGYWKHGDSVVPFRIDFREAKKIAEGFIQRQSPEPKMEQKIGATMPEDDAVEMVKAEMTGNVWEMSEEQS
jgi:Type IV secretion-system coupling protein DNA-binding domain